MPSELAKCTFELVQASKSNASTFISLGSLAITVIGWPVVYLLGLSSNRKLEINKAIDQLDDSMFELRKFATELGEKSFCNSDYQTSLAMFMKIRNICERIAQLDKKRDSPKELLRNLKMVSTDELFYQDRNLAVSKILTIQVALSKHYTKSM
ncbi:hypothetical protein P7M42_01955 [Vibrio parahaemolyticus]|uniref:hypothetical protein n=1 Tax=Vibrio parahaemolyticus TaxID=670 RepID=UPI0004705FC6|nr:hypothetical protein [Vibrio parahaemolyticus]MDG2669017.1 hypothetical protein [Vibrio parahaemolyticus]MDG2789882.1 hypothetical protein [Vibrio parahaemolyticus]HCZ9539443.1 hypothetical protein [Vibrio alginolyticus]